MSSIFSLTDAVLPMIHARGAPTSAEANSDHQPPQQSADTRPYNTRTGNYHPTIEAAFIVDTDPTKDFDPENADDLQQNVFSKRARHPPRPFNPSLTPREFKEKVNTWQAGRHQGLLGGRIVMKLNQISEEGWKTETGQRVLEWLLSWADNWPATPDPDNEESWSELQLESIRKDRLRERSERQQAFFDGLGSSAKADWKEVTLGHPAARGCKTCYELGIECPLIKGEIYPCEVCEEEREVCELIMQPKKKRACESCTKRRAVCSFRAEAQGDHTGPCKACADKGITCIAGPKSGLTREGPSLDCPPQASEPSDNLLKRQVEVENPAVAVKRQRRAKCAQCKESRAYCSLSQNPKPGTCARCRKLRLACMHEGAAEPVCLREVAPSPDPEAALHQPRRPRHWVYDENVEFLYAGAAACSWCKCESHGFFGLLKNSEYLQNARDEGLIGARELRTLPTSSRMCYYCTESRVEITACLTHELGHLQEAPGDPGQGVEDSFLLPGMASLAPWPWCMVCPRRARFQCCRERPRQLNGQWERCGLRLCEDCACALTLDYVGDLNELIRGKEAVWETELDLRADANFLSNNGALLASFVRP